MAERKTPSGATLQSPEVASRLKFVDPEHVPVRVVNAIPHMSYVGTLVDLTLGTHQIGVQPDGSLAPETVIAARIRFDLEMARILHLELGRLLATLTKPEGPTN